MASGDETTVAMTARMIAKTGGTTAATDDPSRDCAAAATAPDRSSAGLVVGQHDDPGCVRDDGPGAHRRTSAVRHIYRLIGAPPVGRRSTALFDAADPVGSASKQVRPCTGRARWQGSRAGLASHPLWVLPGIAVVENVVTRAREARLPCGA